MSNFKRENELVEQVNQIAETLDDDSKGKIKELVRKYENATYKEWGDRGEFSADTISGFVNDFNFADELIADKMAHEHPTLQQSFMRFVFKFIKKMADKSCYDARNERSVMFAKKVMEAASNDACFPMI